MSFSSLFLEVREGKQDRLEYEERKSGSFFFRSFFRRKQINKPENGEAKMRKRRGLCQRKSSPTIIVSLQRMFSLLPLILRPGRN
jgi:hypothetical protein